MTRLIIINTHLIQYFAPLYQELARDKTVDLMVLYCSNHNKTGSKDVEFGVDIKWDIPLLKGYNAHFLKNYYWGKFTNGAWELVNWGILKWMIKSPKSILIIHGWNNITNWLVIIFGTLLGHKVCLKGETPLSQELRKPKWKKVIRHIFFRVFLRPFCSKFLYIGTENKNFYTHYGVKEKQLIFSPLAVDNSRFKHAFLELNQQKKEIRNTLGLPLDKRIFIFSGKYISKKRPLDLLKAFRQANHNDIAVVFMGDGALRSEMEAYIEAHQLDSIFLTGFVNQSKVPLYYAASDVYVMCSEDGETWGLSTNEAMSFNLPILVSNLTGCSIDLVQDGENGFRFKTGDIADFSKKINYLADLSTEALEKMGEKSSEIINEYSYEVLIDNLKQINQ